VVCLSTALDAPTAATYAYIVFPLCAATGA